MKTVSKVVIYYTDGSFEELSKTWQMPSPATPYPWPPVSYPHQVDPSYLQKATCNTCGITFDGHIGYVCTRQDCPSSVRCGISTNGS